MGLSQRHKIVLADDEPQNLRSLFNALASENYRIYTAPDGKVAYEQVLKHMPNAVIMDWDMPGTSGLEAIKRIRENPGTKYIPIIMATGKMTSTENLETALKAGANDYIRKPFDNIEIIARVKSMIGLHLEYKKNIKLQTQVAEQELASIRKELERNTSALATAKLKLIESGQNLSQLIGELQKLRGHVSGKGDEMITEIISYSKANCFVVNWKEFETLFGKVHQSFYGKLQSLFPGLTQKEKNLCALIKLNMDTKEISAVTSRKADAVKKAKNRLRTKLGIEKMGSLYRFLQEIN